MLQELVLRTYVASLVLSEQAAGRDANPLSVLRQVELHLEEDRKFAEKHFLSDPNYQKLSEGERLLLVDETQQIVDDMKSSVKGFGNRVKRRAQRGG